MKKKYLKLSPKITKNQKFYIFQNFNAIYVKFLTEFVDWNVEKRQQGKTFSPVGFSCNFCHNFDRLRELKC